MKIFKVVFHQHVDHKKKYGWVLVLAEDETKALEFAYRDLIRRVPGYAYHVDVKELCSVKEGRCAYIYGDFLPMSLSAYEQLE